MTHLYLEDETELTVEDKNYVVLFGVTADMIYEPAKLSGPPEDCYPDNSECNIEDVKVLGVWDEEGDSIQPSKALLAELLAEYDPEDLSDEFWKLFFAEAEPEDDEE